MEMKKILILLFLSVNLMIVAQTEDLLLLLIGTIFGRK